MRGKPRSLRPDWTRSLTHTAVRIATICLLVVVMTMVVAVPALYSAPSFSDIDDSPYREGILDLASRGIISGYADDRFGPLDPVTRQQYAKMVVLAAGFSCTPADICPFTDVERTKDDSLYPDHFVAVASAHGITVGTGPGLFSPYAHITRYQVISMAVRAANELQPSLLQTPPSAWEDPSGWGDDPTHGTNARLAEYGGLLEGLPLESLSPWEVMPRGEVAQILHNLLETLDGSSVTTTEGVTTSSTGTSTTSSTDGSTTTSSTDGSTTSSTSSSTTSTTQSIGTIAGKILDYDGHPVTSGTVRVYEYRAFQPLGALVAEVPLSKTGAYVTPVLSFGDYCLLTQGTPYVEEWYGGKFEWALPETSTIVRVDPGPVSGIDFVLGDYARITGRAVDEFGNPVDGTVQAMLPNLSGAIGGTAIAPDGSYVVEPITRACVLRTYSWLWDEWFDDIRVIDDPAATKATVFDLRPGQTVDGVDFVLADKHLLQGFVLLSAGGLVPRGAVRAVDVDSGATFDATISRGWYSFPDLPPRVYKIHTVDTGLIDEWHLDIPFEKDPEGENATLVDLRKVNVVQISFSLAAP